MIINDPQFCSQTVDFISWDVFKNCFSPNLKDIFNEISILLNESKLVHQAAKNSKQLMLIFKSIPMRFAGKWKLCFLLDTSIDQIEPNYCAVSMKPCIFDIVYIFLTFCAKYIVTGDAVIVVSDRQLCKKSNCTGDIATLKTLSDGDNETLGAYSTSRNYL